MDDLYCGECFDVQFGRSLSDRAEHVGVVAKGQPWMQATDDMHLGGAGVGSLLCFFDYLLYGVLISTVLSLLAIERTELARQRTEIGVVQMTVNVVVNQITVQALFDHVCQLAHRPDVGCGQ